MIGAGIAILPILLVIFVGLAITAAWIYTLIDIIQRDFDGENEQLLWVLVILFAGIIGSIIYYFVVIQEE